MDNSKIRKLNNDLSYCLQNLDSHKITERKAERQKVMELLDNDDVIELLNSNSLQQSQSTDSNNCLVTWKCLLNSCHRSLIQDIEKEDIKRRKSGTNYKRPNLESSSILLKCIISKANKEQPYLPGNDLLKCVLDVSQNCTYQSFMGEVYYKILEQNIVSQSYYWHLLSRHWNDLFSLACNLYTADFANMKHISIKIMKHIVMRGSAYSNVTLTIKRKIFSYLKQAITDTLKINSDFYLREDLISLVFVVCETIGIECRKSLCQFIEENCTHLINFYENDSLKKIQEMLYKLLTFFIKIHHPKCVGLNHKVSYIYNEETWVVQLHHIYEFVLSEIQLIEYNSTPKFSNYISELAVTIFNIVYFNKLDTSYKNFNESPTPKRKKKDMNLLSFLDDLFNLKASELIIRLNIITKLLENNSLPLMESDIIHLLLCITKCFSCYKDSNLIRHLIICSNVLINSKYIVNLLLTKFDQVEMFLKTVWTFMLKTILSNENSDVCHNFLQSLIVLNYWHDEMYSDVLRLYFNKTVKIDDHSLKTLIVLFNTRGFCNVSFNRTNMLLFLDWLLPIEMQDELLFVELYSKINPYILSEVVDLILTKSSINTSFIINNSSKTDTSKNSTSIYFYLILQSIPKVQSQITKPVKQQNTRQISDDFIFQRLVNFIEKTMAIDEKPNVVTLRLFFSLTNFLCCLESQFPQLNDKHNIFGLHKLKYMKKIETILLNFKNEMNHLNNEEFVNACFIFYKHLQYADSNTVDIILNYEANKAIISKLYNLSKLNDSNNMYQMLNYDSLSNTQKLSIKSTEILLNLCSYESQILSYQLPLLEIIVEDLINFEDSFNQPYTYFKFTNFCHIIFNLKNVPIEIIVQANKFVKQLAKNWCFHQDGFIKITQLLCDALSIITKNNSNEVCTTNILMIIWSLQKISNSQKCGPTMICAFVDLLGHFASSDNGSFGSIWNIDTKITKPMSPENILYYINSPFLQVRVAVIKYIYVMCDAYENNPNTYTMSYLEMLNVLLQNIHKGFIVNSDISENECDDEYTNRVATYLLCIQAFLISSKQFRKECLFEMFQTVNNKQINLNLVISLLKGVAVELKIKSYVTLLEDNLSFLLWNWHLKYSTFKEFPITLFFCTTIEQFLKKYSFEIIPILIIKNDLDVLNSMGNVYQAVETNFPVIFSYLLAIKVGNDPFLDYNIIKCFIENKLDEKHFNELIKTQFSDILLKCIQMIVINTDEPIIPIQINSDQFLTIINIFQETYVKSKMSLLTGMSKKQPNYIQSIVHILYVNIFKKSTSELKRRSFFQYTFFMKILICQLSEYNDIDDFTHFIVYQSVRSTITLINQNNIGMQHDALEYLEWLFFNTQRFLKLNTHQIQPLTTSSFRILAKNNPLIKDKLLNILNILKELRNTNTEYKTNINTIKSLHEDINVFLSQEQENSDVVQSLQQLKLKLKTEEKQLQNMYKKLLKIPGFSEDCVKSPLHCFICKLIQLIKSCDTEVQMLAASCLGILGPADLTTLILQPEPEVLKFESNTSMEYSFIKHIVVILLNYLSDGNISVMEASNIALFKMLATREAQSLDDELSKNVVYPFIPLQVELQDTESLFNVEEFKIKLKEFNSMIDVKEIWCPTDFSISYSNWITKITKLLLEILQGNCKSLLPIAENKPVFCENILPHLIFFLILYMPLSRHILSKHLNSFFTEHHKIKKDKTSKMNTNLQVFDPNANNIYCNKSAIQSLLNIISFIRRHQKNPLQKLLDVNYLYVSEAAQFCSAHFTSILYLELWCEMKFSEINKDHWSMSFNPVDTITEMLPDDGLLLQSILIESYKSIGDSDAIEGCGSSYLLSLSSRTQYYQLLKKWDRVMENCDLQQTTEFFTKDYLEAFYNSGLQNVAHLIASNNNNLKYDFSWQLNEWNLPDIGKKSFEALHYHALKYVYKKNIASAVSKINEARLTVIGSLSCASLESTATIYTPLAKLKIIEDLEDFISISDKNMLFEKWLNQKSLGTNDFVNINKILLQRSKLMEFNNDKRSGILKLNIAEIAKSNNCLQEAGRTLATVVSLETCEKHTILWANLEEARLLWQRNDCHMARILLKSVVEKLDNSYEYPFLHSLALQLYGSWMEETKSETANDIIKKYFQKSIKILPLDLSDKKECGMEYKKVLSAAHKHLSQYTDTLYQQISKQIKTKDLQKRIHEVEGDKKKGEALMASAKSTKNNEKLKASIFFIKQCNLDESDITNINMEKIKYLKIAVQNYLQLMTLDDESELPIYRVISLWLENKENNEINEIVDKEFKKIPSYKYITVLPQLIPHLSSAYEYTFHKSLENLINRCAIEHPYHTIPIVYAIANSNEDKTYTQYQKSTNNKEETRIAAAKHLMSIWKKNTKISSIVVNTNTLYAAFIRLAYTTISCSQGQCAKIPNDQPLINIQYTDDFMYPAITLPLNILGHYSNIICIKSFKNSFFNAGGVHQAKKIDCLCSDGIVRSLLLKNNEDMRQDAVMQQVFELMNRLLQSNKLTAKRKLTIRTYKVIPFSQQSGIAEWCENTMSLGDYLVGKNSNLGAHQKYRPNDCLPSNAKSIIKESRNNGDSQIARLKKYLSICENLKPVLRYYFFEKFISPSIWFERRQAYIHSIATTSMVGYILGIGDRHPQNILIDNNTAEIIHIDFGVAFDQGTLLLTPETVPFRLSRDIVDGLGICGIEGTFRKCCEKSMSVLRQNQDVIVTVVEVLLYDPCYQWALTEEKAAQLQDQSNTENSDINNSTEVNKLAERSLNKIRIKLSGMEEAGNAATINGQVNRLIQLAKDPANLSMLFCGWQAYL